MATTQEPDLQELLQVAVANALARVHVSLPATVVSYDATTQTATVQPMVKRVVDKEDGGTTALDFAPIQNVKVRFPAGGGCSLTFPLEAGDGVDLIFYEASVSEYRLTGQKSAPADLTRLGLSYAWCQPGELTIAKVLGPQALGTGLVLNGPEIRLGGILAKLVAIAEKVDANVNALQGAFDTHIHTTTATVGASAVPGVISAPTSLVGPLPSTAASKTKAE
jgi:hypothetical protein